MVYNKISHKWEELNEKKAINKTCQALREKQPYLRKAMEILPIISVDDDDDEALKPLNSEEIKFIVETFCSKNMLKD